MKLISIFIEGYRRFATAHTLQVDCRLVALLGPNEAGKTSLLRVLLSLNGKDAFHSEGPSQDITRNTQRAGEHVIAKAKFLLEQADRDALRDVGGVGAPMWLTVSKAVNGSRTYDFVPAIQRNLEARGRILAKLKEQLAEIADSKTLSESSAAFMEAAQNVVASIPNGDIQTLSKDALDALDHFASLASEVGDRITSDLVDLIEIEKAHHPDDAARNLIAKRVPQFVLFDEEDRNLLSSYNLSDFFGGGNKSAVPRALQNLASTAKLDLDEIVRAVTVEDHGAAETLIVSANETLKQKMAEAWNQSDSFVRLRLTGLELKVLVGTYRTRFESITERSDGLRQFVALFALLSGKLKRKTEIVLLIDEAEHHLHYDAQADLVQMLAKQELARQVLYTTHSIGCLPEDLGTGVRLIAPMPDSEHSKIVNKFWSQNDTGLSPVLFGIGATTMAFLPVRYCLLTEGPTDMLLAPSLLREATGRDTLGFQVAPGLAEANDSQVAILQREGNRVAFLLDGDEGGNAIATKLAHAGISNDEIVRLAHSDGTQCVIEDFLDPTVYASAINEELARSGNGEHQISVEDLVGTQRPNKLRSWCVERGINAPKKIDVAYRVLDRIHEGSLIDAAQLASLRSLHDRIEAAFRKLAAPSLPSVV